MRNRPARAEVLSGVAKKNAATDVARQEAQRTQSQTYLKLVPEAPEDIAEPVITPPTVAEQKPRRVSLHDTGLLFEGQKSREIREKARERAAYLREKYKTQKPPTDLETITEIGDVFMSPEKRAALRAKRKEKAIVKKVPLAEARKMIKKPIHVRWFGRFGGALAALAALASAMGTPEVQSRIGSPTVRANAERVLRNREVLRTEDAIARVAEETLAERTAEFESAFDVITVRQRSLDALLKNQELVPALEGYFNAPTPQVRDMHAGILRELGYQPVQTETGEHIVIPILHPEVAETLQKYIDATTPERKALHARYLGAMGYVPVRVNEGVYTVLSLPQSEEAN